MNRAEIRLRRRVEQWRTEYLWGQRYRVKPRLVSEVFGDGGLMIALEPLNTRPNFYVVRVDSSWQLSNSADEADGDLLLDHVEEIYDAIASQFGECDYDSCPIGVCDCDFPILDVDCGSSWGVVRWPRGIRRPVPRSETEREWFEGPMR